MLTINSIRNGIVIDHIKAGYGIKIYNYLKLDEAEFPTALIMNAVSKKKGAKDMIKIENVMNLDLTVLGFLDPNITVNIIENEKIKEKIQLKLPAEIENVIKCNNPRCVTSVEKYVAHKFKLVDEKNGEYKCEYCDEIYKGANI